MAYKRISPGPVVEGMTGKQSFTPYTVICAGTTSTGPLQSIASAGNSSDILVSNGPLDLPTFKSIDPEDTNVVYELVSSDPVSPTDSFVWFNTTSNGFKGSANSSSVTFTVT
jgi:hypothetical protein